MATAHSRRSRSRTSGSPARPARARESQTRKRRRSATTARSPRKWSAAVNRTSDALDLQPKVFAGEDPKAIARSLKRSAERSRRRKATPYRSAMSMLTFYINRAGNTLSKRRLDVLQRAKIELRRAFHRP